MARALSLGLLLVLANAATASGQVAAYLIGGDALYRVDLASGAFEEVGPLTPSGGLVLGLAFDPSGTLLGWDSDGGRLLAIDTATAATTVLGSFDLGFERGTGLTVDACGRIFLMTFHWFNYEGVYLLRTLDPGRGEAALVGEIPYNVGPLAARGELLYGISPSDWNTSGAGAVVRIRPDPLEVTEVATGLPLDAACGGLDFDGAGHLWTAWYPPPIGIPPPPPPVLRIDLTSGEIEEFPAFYGINLAISPPAGVCGGGGGPLAIPTASPAALLILAATLGIAGVAALAQRRGRPADLRPAPPPRRGASPARRP